MDKKKPKYKGDPPKGVSIPAHHVRDAAKATKAAKKRKREDFSQAAARIVRQATEQD